MRAYNGGVKAIKISTYKGRTLYRVGKYSVKVTRQTVSQRAGCGLRHHSSVVDWYAIDMENPVENPSYGGYGGIRDAVKKLSTLI